jgi:peptidyl-prolyl cis-trans isomerase B (cyclophilin B)
MSKKNNNNNKVNTPLPQSNKKNSANNSKILVVSIIAICFIILLIIGIVLSNNSKNSTAPKATQAPTATQAPQTPQKNNTDTKGDPTMSAKTMKTVTVDTSNAKKPLVTITMADGGVMKAELYPDIAPITVENFVKLINKGFYNGLIFHRIISGFMIQGGDPQGTGTGGPGYQIKGEFSSNGVKNDLKHTRGVLSMARSQSPDSAGSQFFIMHADAPHLDGEYAAFGKVTEGLDVVDKIAALK